MKSKKREREGRAERLDSAAKVKEREDDVSYLPRIVLVQQLTSAEREQKRLSTITVF